LAPDAKASVAMAATSKWRIAVLPQAEIATVTPERGCGKRLE